MVRRVQPGPLAEPAVEGLRVADPRANVDAAREAALVEPAARLRVARDVRRRPPAPGRRRGRVEAHLVHDGLVPVDVGPQLPAGAQG